MEVFLVFPRVCVGAALSSAAGGREQVKCEEDGRILIIGCDTNPTMTRTRLMLPQAGMMRCVVWRIIQIYELGCYGPLTQLLAAETCIW